MEEEIVSRHFDKLEEVVSGLRRGIGSFKEVMQCLSLRFEQFFKREEDKVLLAKQELGKGEEQPVEPRDSSPVTSVFRSGSSWSSGNGGGTSSGFKGDFGFFDVFDASRNSQFITPPLSVSKSGSAKYSDIVDSGSCGNSRGSSKGSIDFLDFAGGSKSGKSSLSAGSASKFGSSDNLGGSEGSSNGFLTFSSSRGSSESFGIGGETCFPTWEKS